MILYSLLGFIIILGVLWDAFETIILPLRVTRRFRIARVFYRITWKIWSQQARITKNITPKQETYLGFFGPLSFILLIAFWATLLIVGFGLVYFGFQIPMTSPSKIMNLGMYLYASGTTFFTLGLGDVIPQSPLGRFLFVVEAGTGFGFLGMIIGYIPTFYQAYSQRETTITMLDARAGSPPSAMLFLDRYTEHPTTSNIGSLLAAWELWCAQLLQTHLSHPLLAYYRSQHENESWIATLTTILDVCAFIQVGIDDISTESAQFTFAMARHVVVDLTQLLDLPIPQDHCDRITPKKIAVVREKLKRKGVTYQGGEKADKQLLAFFELYEPYVHALSQYFLMSVPPLITTDKTRENWRSTP